MADAPRVVRACEMLTSSAGEGRRELVTPSERAASWEEDKVWKGPD